MESGGKIKDLTGTTWLLNLDAETTEESISGRELYFTAGGETFSEIYFPLTKPMVSRSVYYYAWQHYGSGTRYYGKNLEQTSYGYYLFSLQSQTFVEDSSYQTISIKGGYYATNTTLIDWLYVNATLQS